MFGEKDKRLEDRERRVKNKEFEHTVDLEHSFHGRGEKKG